MEVFMAVLVAVCIVVFLRVLFGGSGDSREMTVLEERRRPEREHPTTGWTPESDVIYSRRTSRGRTIQIERRGRGCTVASDTPQNGRGGVFTVTTPEGDAYEWREPEL